MSRLLSLYPRTWRDRYEDEFRSLMADRPPSRRERFDIVRGAIDARLHPQVPGRDLAPDRFGFATLAGLVAFVIAIVVAANGPLQYDSYGTYRDGVAAVPFMIVAAIILAASLYRVVRRLPGDALIGQSAGWLAIVVAPFWPAIVWVLPVGIVFLGSVMVLAVAAHRAGIWPAWLTIALNALLAIPATMMVVLMFLPWYTMRQQELSPLLLLVPVGAMWVLVGVGLLRGFPVTGAPADAPTSVES